MNIQKYNNNYAPMPQRAKIQLNSNIPAFKGAKADVIAKEVLPMGTKFFTWFGEQAKNPLFNIPINAIGTAVVAPIMIVFNPFAKGEKTENKVYSALRQPVSAVLAIALQTPISALVGGLCVKACKEKKFDIAGLAKLSTVNAKGELIGKGLGFSRIMTIAFSLVTLVPQVKVLNWLYPKFITVAAPVIKTLFKLDITKKEKAKTPPEATPPTTNPVAKNVKVEGKV